MLATYPQSCAYKSVFTSDNGGHQVFCKTRRACRDLLFSLLVASILFCSEIRTPPPRFEDIDLAGVASRLMQGQGEPYRAPLRLVLRRQPVAFFKYKDRQDLGLFNVGVYIRETLECGHALNITPHELEPLIAKRRRCRECLDAAAALPPKKPSRPEKASEKEREAA